MPPFRLVTYNFLAGGSARRTRQWSRLVRTLAADLVFGQECRPPEASADEPFRLADSDALVWTAARSPRWGSGVLVRGGALARVAVPQFDGWVAGGIVHHPRLAEGPVHVFSVHGPAGERGYVRTMHEILDRLARIANGADMIIGGDFNVAVGYRAPGHPRPLSRGEVSVLDRLDAEHGLVSAWQAAHPDRPLAQTLRWSTNPTTPYHCDGIFIPRAWTARLAGARVVRGARWKQLSDHNPVLADLRPP